MDATQPVNAWQENSPDGRLAADGAHQNAYVVGPSGFLGTLEGDRAQPVVTGPLLGSPAPPSPPATRSSPA